MSTALAYSTEFDRHETGRHPEQPDRLAAVVEAMERRGLMDQLAEVPFNPLTAEQLHAVHDPLYVEQVRDAFADGVRRLDADTPISEHSYDVARLAGGAAVAAAEAVMQGDVRRVFCAVRPPGHHAEHDKAMGFCLFNNVALAAQHLTRHHGLKRVAIVDFDVHHGNGTQHTFEERADVLFVSIHQDPRTIFPGTGLAEERGKGEGEGYTLNLPMRPESDDDAYRAAFEEAVLPRLHAYRPEVLLVSAGFDAAAEDPLAQIRLTEQAFRWMTRQLVAVAEATAAGRLISVLEGGYDLQALGRDVAAHVETLLL